MEKEDIKLSIFWDSKIVYPENERNLHNKAFEFISELSNVVDKEKSVF